MRNTAAADWDGLRIHPQSFLETRNAHEVVYDAEQVEQVFAYKNFLLAIIDDKLQWGRARTDTDVSFQDFDPELSVEVDARFQFAVVENATGEYILISDGVGEPEHLRGSPYFVDLKDVFDEGDPQDPTVSRCYLPQPNNPYGITGTDVNSSAKNSDADFQENTQIEFFFQAVRTIDEQEGVPWIHDFTKPNADLPALQPTLAVSDSIKSIEVEGDDPFSVAYQPGDLPDSGLLEATGVTGGDSDDVSIALNTATAPDSVHTQDSEAIWAILPGSIRVELTGYTIVLDLFSTVRLQVRVNDSSWVTIGSNTDFLNQNFSARDTVAVNYEAFTFGRLPADAEIEFRITASNGDIELLDSPTILFQVQGQFTFLTLDLADLSNVDGEDLRAQYDRQPRTEITFYLNLGAADEAADYIDVYRSRRRQLPDAFGSGYQLIARLPHEDQYEFTLKIPVTDEVLPQTWVDLPEQGETVVWKYIDTDGVRAYAAPENSDKLYLSFFDNISERRYMNFTDVVNLPTAGEVITGVRFLRREYLVVYTARRIILVRTDPAAERCSVVDQLPTSPNDAAIGCFAPDSLASYSGYHLFLGPDKRVYRYGGQNVRWVGDKVEPLLIPLESEVPDDVSFRPANAVGAIHQGLYFLSFPSLLEDISHLVVWKGEPVEWDGGDGVADIEWKPGEFVPNTTLILDIERDRWYQDKFGITSFAKDHLDRLYGVVQGTLFLLYYVDADSNIRWRWKSNKFLLPRNMLLFNVFVYVQTAADMTVTLRTEQGEESQELSVADAFDYFSQYAGFALWGRTAEIEVTGTGPVTIDRIALNQEIE